MKITIFDLTSQAPYSVTKSTNKKVDLDQTLIPAPVSFPIHFPDKNKIYNSDIATLAIDRSAVLFYILNKKYILLNIYYLLMLSTNYSIENEYKIYLQRNYLLLNQRRKSR